MVLYVSGQVKDSPVARNLVSEMTRTGTTTSQLARGIGTSERQITRWRTGTTQPRAYEKVAAIASYFGRSPRWFFTEHDNERVAA